MGLYTKLAAFVIFFTIVFILFGVVVGLGGCAAVQGLDICFTYFTATLARFF